MPRPTPSTAHPLQTLRENSEALKASILACLGKPSKNAVHRLRTYIRRIEAQLELLAMLPELPPHRKQARRAVRLLKRLRRAAGKVRDLDVQRDLISNEACGPRPTSELRKEAKDLRRTLKLRRDEEVEALLQTLKKHLTEFSLVLDNLLGVLAPAESISLSEARLTALVREWYAQYEPASDPAPQDSRQLHRIRKRAKLARYLAESAPKSAASLHRLAAHFEGLQQAGGEWHDWLLLQGVSAAELGKGAKLPKRFSIHADASLRAYKLLISKHQARFAAQAT